MGLSRLEKDVLHLLTSILDDVDEQQEYIVCVMAKVDSYRSRRLASKEDTPIVYGYVRERIPVYLMKRGILTNIPREGYDLKLISGSDLAKAEIVINRADNWNINKKVEFISRFLTRGASTDYPTAQPYLMFRSKVGDYIKSIQDKRSSGDELTKADEVNFPKGWKLSGENIVFDQGGIIKFQSQDTNECRLFKYILEVERRVTAGELIEKFEPKTIADVTREMVRLKSRIGKQGKGWLVLEHVSGDIKKKGSAVYWLHLIP